MANRRMFSLQVVDSDEFLEMQPTARLLYYDLGMRADDDGFVQPKKIMRLTNSNPDDLKVLMAKKFVIPFDDGKVLVIADWKINNLIRSDRYSQTIFNQYKKLLKLDVNNRYTTGQPNDIPLVDVGKDSIGEDSIDKDRIGKVNKLSNQGFENNKKILMNKFTFNR